MPKMTKKLLEKKKDFKKVKLKVGKKQEKANETRTTFKSQAIVVPGQSIAEEKGEVTTGRNQTLKELLSHCKHYNPNVRKDGIIGVREILLKHPQNILVHLSVVFETTFAAIVDEDAGVRQALLSFLVALTPRLTANNVSPFISLFMSYCASGMTHIYDAIRLHSLDYLNLWMEAFPLLIVNSHIRILPQFLSLLSNFDQKTVAGQSSSLITNPTGKLDSTKSRISVLSSLFRYLDSSISQQKATTWFDHFRKEEAASSSARPPTFTWNPSTPLYISAMDCSPFMESKPLNISRAMDVDQQDPQKGDPSKNFLHTLNLHDLAHCQQFIKVMTNILLETWIEAVPGLSTEFISASAATNRASCKMVLELLILLWEHHESLVKISPNAKHADVVFLQQYVKDIKKHFAGHFPFGQSIVAKIDAKTLELVKQMNVLFCRMTSILLQPLEENSEALVKLDKGKAWQRSCLDHLKSLLVFDRNQPPLGAELFENLLPVLWRFFVTLPETEREALLQHLITFGDGSGSQSNVKKLYLDLISKHFFFDDDHQSWTPKTSDILTKWATSLTKLLWELGNKNPDTTRLIFLVLGSLAKKQGGDSKSLFATLQLSLIPFFSVTIAPKEEGGKPKRVFGPFVTLPVDIQRMSINLLYYFDQLPSKLVEGLTPCLNNGAVHPSVVRQALQIISLKEPLFQGLPQVYVSFLASLWTGYTQDQLRELRKYHTTHHGGRFIPMKTVVHVLHEGSLTTGHQLWAKRVDVGQGLAHSLRAMKILSADDFIELTHATFAHEMLQCVPIDFCFGFFDLLSRLQLQSLPDELQALVSTFAGDLLLESLEVTGEHKQETFQLVLGTLGCFFEKFPTLLVNLLEKISENLQAAATPEDLRRHTLLLAGVTGETKLAAAIDADREGSLATIQKIVPQLELLSKTPVAYGFAEEVQRLITDLRIKYRIV